MPENESVSDSTSILNLRLGRVSNRKQLDSKSKAIETDVDRDALIIAKELFDAAELRACYSYLAALKAQVRSYSAPAKHLRGGMYMVKTLAIQIVSGILDKAQIEFNPLVEAFANVVDIRRDEASKRLGPAFDAGDYPNKAQVLAAFSIEWDWLTLATPSALKRISQEFFDQEKVKAEIALKSAVTNIEGLLLADMKHLVDRMADRLSPDALGKKKIFRDSLIENAKNFVATFSFRNVSSSEELELQVKKIGDLIDGIDPKSLRDNDSLRHGIAGSFEKIGQSLESMMKDAPSRVFDLGQI